MSELTKLYNWTNIILNPILLILVFVSQSDVAIGIAMSWALISAVLNENIRNWILGIFASITGATLVLACIGSLVGIFVLIAVASIALTLGFFIVLPLLWVLSLKDIIDAQRSLI